MIRPIVLYGHPVLRRVAAPVEAKQEGLSALIDDLLQTMYGAEGLGLAAPQIGVSLQLFAVTGRYLQDKGLAADYEEIFINPRLSTNESPMLTLEEGCLSLPGMRADVRRPAQITLQYEDRNRHPRTLKTDGLLARIIQHEYDHLQGKLFIDHLSFLSRRMLKKKLATIHQASPDYPVLAS